MKYFVTYKMLGSEYPDESDYKICESKLDQHGFIIFTRFEHDSHGKLHVHYIWEYSNHGKELYRNKLEIKGYNKFVIPILDNQSESIIYNYLQKDDRRYFRTNYAF